MATIPAHLKLSPEEQTRLDMIRAAATARHERERKAAAKRGRDYPSFPYECSAAYEAEFIRGLNKKPTIEPVPAIFANQQRAMIFKQETPGWSFMDPEQLKAAWDRFVQWYGNRDGVVRLAVETR